MSYTSLKSIMLENGVTKDLIAEVIDKSFKTVDDKLEGRESFLYWEAQEVQKLLPGYSLEELFEKDELIKEESRETNIFENGFNMTFEEFCHEVVFCLAKRSFDKDNETESRVQEFKEKAGIGIELEDELNKLQLDIYYRAFNAGFNIRAELQDMMKEGKVDLDRLGKMRKGEPQAENFL